MRSCVILGSGRSGTSMVAGTLQAAGYHMGDNLLPPTSSNPKGYFEDQAINNLNEDILNQVAPVKPSTGWGRLYPWRLAYGSRWLATLDPTVIVRATPEIAERMVHLTYYRPFCFKDPRFCYTLDTWRPALGDVVFLCVFREPGRTAASMMTDTRERGYDIRLSRRRALRVWTSMYQHVLSRHRHRGQWLFVHYDQFLDGSAVPRVEALLETEIDAGFVDRQLKRSAGSLDVPRQTEDVYRQLCAAASVRDPSLSPNPAVTSDSSLALCSEPGTVDAQEGQA
ncbi:MAG TPA: sulfotransferase [Solirubrobacteraceae bacterium]|nr:sulfotransferase [Solirubrobacteraceae bacterium]